MKTLQEQYNLIKENKAPKDVFIKEAKAQFPDIIPMSSDFNSIVSILKRYHIISEGIGGVATSNPIKPEWFQIFEEFNTTKVEEKKTSEEVEELQTKGWDMKNKDEIDNVFGMEFLQGFYAEMGDPKNKDKSVEDLKKIVAKNLAKDPLFYIKGGQFGVKGLGYTDEAPGLKASKTDQMVKVPLKEMKYSPKNRQAMKKLWGLTDEEIDEKEKWNNDLKKGTKTIQDYANSPLGKKMEKIMTGGLKEENDTDNLESVKGNKSQIEDIKSQLDSLEVEYQMSDNETKPFKVIYKPINKPDDWYSKFDNIVHLANLGGVVKTKNLSEEDLGKSNKFVAALGSKLIKSEDKEDFIKQVESQGFSLEKILEPEDDGYRGHSIINRSWTYGMPKFKGLLGPMKDVDTIRYETQEVYDRLSLEENNMYNHKNTNKMGKISLLDLVEGKIPEKKALVKPKRESIEDRIREIEKKGSVAALEAKMNALDEEIEARESKLNMISENSDFEEFVNTDKVKEIQREIKELTQAKERYGKQYERSAGKSYVKPAPVIEEPVSEDPIMEIRRGKNK